MSDRSIGHGPGKTADPWIARMVSRLVQISTRAWLCAPRRFMAVRSGGRSFAGMAPSVASPAPATAPAQPAPPPVAARKPESTGAERRALLAGAQRLDELLLVHGRPALDANLLGPGPQL